MRKSEIEVLQRQLKISLNATYNLGINLNESITVLKNLFYELDLRKEMYEAINQFFMEKDKLSSSKQEVFEMLFNQIYTLTKNDNDYPFYIEYENFDMIDDFLFDFKFKLNDEDKKYIEKRISYIYGIEYTITEG